MLHGFINLVNKSILMKATLLVFILISLELSIFAQEKQIDYTEAFKLIDVWLDAQRDYDHVPGMSVIAVNDQEVMWSGAYGMANPEEQVKATPSTLYSICSISKLFTSVAIMKLYDQGKLRLDDEIDDLLPWYDLKQKYPDSWPITVRTLLTHSSGLPRESNHPYWTGPEHPFPEADSVKSELHNQETLYPSSLYWQYSNLGMALLGQVVEELSGMPYEDYIRTQILDPLEMKDTRTFLPENLYGTGLDSTSAEILKPSTLKQMYNVHWVDPDGNNTWGFGFGIVKVPDGERMVGHSGHCPGYNTLFSMVPTKKRAYAVFTNAQNTKRSTYVRGMHALLEKYKKEVSREPQNEKAPCLEEYTGYYSMLPWQYEIYMASWHNKLLMLSLPADNPAESMLELKYISKDLFRRVRGDGELGEAFEFERDKNGTIYRIKRHNNYFSRIVK